MHIVTHCIIGCSESQINDAIHLLVHQKKDTKQKQKAQKKASKGK
jgi:hypothetical protein